MPAPILATRLFVPPARPKVVLRPRLFERPDDGLRAGRRLTLVSASAGSGKTTLVREWAAGAWRPVAWLSLDEGVTARIPSPANYNASKPVPGVPRVSLRCIHTD